MKKKKLIIIFSAVIFFGFFGLAKGSQAATLAVEKGEIGEVILTSTNSYTNKFDVSLSAIFTQGTTSYRFYGFYSGGNIWKIRFNLPLTGTWTYVVTSSDSQLDNPLNDGSVTITAPSSDNKGCLVKDGRRVKWENTGETFLIMGHTAWYLTSTTTNYQQTLDWMNARGFDLVLADLFASTASWSFGGTISNPDWYTFNLAQWDRADSIVQYAQSKNIAVEFGPYLEFYMQNGIPSDAETRLARYIAARLGAYPNVVYSGPSTEYTDSADDVAAIKSMYEELSTSFYRRPLMGQHTVRNQAYFTSGANYGYHSVNTGMGRTQANYTGQAWLTWGTFHEANEFDGWGILQHRYQTDFNMPLYVHEAKYENDNNTLNANLDEPLIQYGIQSEINNNPRRYYRWYTWGSLLSCGSGINYGMNGSYLTGYPNPGFTPTGYLDIKRQLDYYLAKGFSPNACDNKDVDIDNDYTVSGSDMWSSSRGLKRPKMLKDTTSGSNKYLIYNPYYTNLTIKNVPSGLSIEIFNPITGSTYSGGSTGSTPFTFVKPTQFNGEYVLYISPATSYVAQSLTLINADTDLDIGQMTNGMTINLQTTGSNLSIRANTNPSTVGSVKFGLDSNPLYGLENTAPYAIAGDNPQWDYAPWTPSTGSHTVTATPYSGTDATGTAGTPLSISFTVTNSDTAPPAAPRGLTVQ